jgi:cytochrome c oxidase subunit II
MAKFSFKLPWLLLGVGVLALLLTRVLISQSHRAWDRPVRPAVAASEHPTAGAATPQAYATNGERIYFTGVSARTGPIPFTGGPAWMFAGAGCVACHGADGAGGMPIQGVSPVPPDIRYGALTGEGHDHPPFTDATIERAITQGLDPAGRPLSEDMPRFEMTEADLEDLIEYLKVLGGEGAGG